jgi:hypothetical protein
MRITRPWSRNKRSVETGKEESRFSCSVFTYRRLSLSSQSRASDLSASLSPSHGGERDAASPARDCALSLSLSSRHDLCLDIDDCLSLHLGLCVARDHDLPRAPVSLHLTESTIATTIDSLEFSNLYLGRGLCSCLCFSRGPLRKRPLHHVSCTQ